MSPSLEEQLKKLQDFSKMLEESSTQMSNDYLLKCSELGDCIMKSEKFVTNKTDELIKLDSDFQELSKKREEVLQKIQKLEADIAEKSAAEAKIKEKSTDTATVE